MKSEYFSFLIEFLKNVFNNKVIKLKILQILSVVNNSSGDLVINSNIGIK